MSEPRQLTDEEISQLTYQFLHSDFYTLVFKPRHEEEIQRVRALMKMAADKGDMTELYGWQRWLMAIEDVADSWIGTLLNTKNMPTFEPPSYGNPKYPKVKGEDG
jgi:hypothetical protein